MKKSLMMLFLLSSVCVANEDNCSIWQKDALAGSLFGGRDLLADNGIEVEFGLTNVYQNNVRGGLSTHNHKGRFSGSYDIEMEIDAEKLFGLKGGSFYMLAEGGWTDTEGINETSVGSYFGVNGDAAGNRSMDVTELWYEQILHDEHDLRLRVGKMDLTGGFECRGCPVAFDGSLYANDETGQFLNNALINNPTIPFPDRGLATSVYFSPQDSDVYISAAIADAQADARETGFNTTFHDEDYFFSIAEAGFASHIESDKGTMPGAYRFGMWYDPQPKANSDSAKSYRDDNGLYTSFDQMLYKENNDSEDSQGIGAFFRYGYAPSKTNDVTNFFSTGLQYKGLCEYRDDDVLAVGFAQGNFSDSANMTYTDDHEAVYEVYYNAQLTAAISLTPSLQYIVNSGGNSEGDAVVFGARLQMLF